MQDPITYEIRYVGKSSHGLQRIARHKQGLDNKKSHRTRWINKLKRFGLMFIPIILQEFTKKEDLVEAEVYWIMYFRSIGAPLTNMTIGGEGLGHKPTQETIEKVKATKRQKVLNGWTDPKKGLVRDAENRKNISEGTKKAMDTPEVKEKIYKAHLKRATKIKDQNGVIYNSVKEAATILDIDRSSIFNVLNGYFKQVKGYVFTKVQDAR